VKVRSAEIKMQVKAGINYGSIFFLPFVPLMHTPKPSISQQAFVGVAR
jgi:hypothetical protein